MASCLADMMHHRWRDEGGISVAELLVVVSVLGTVLTLSFLVFNSASGIADSTQAKSQAREAGIRVLDMMTKDIRQARKNSLPTDLPLPAFATWTGRDCAFFADVTRDTHPEKIRYYVSGSNLYRTVAPPLNTKPPYVFGTPGPPQLVLAGIKSSWTGNVFTYYAKGNGSVLATSAGSISAVGLKLVNEATVGARTASVELSTTVKCRSLHNSLDPQ